MSPTSNLKTKMFLSNVHKLSVKLTLFLRSHQPVLLSSIGISAQCKKCNSVFTGLSAKVDSAGQNFTSGLALVHIYMPAKSFYI